MESGNGTITSHAAVDGRLSWARRRRVLAAVATSGAASVEDAAVMAVLREHGLLAEGTPATLTSLGALVLDEEDGDEDEPDLVANRPQNMFRYFIRQSRRFTRR